MSQKRWFLRQTDRVLYISKPFRRRHGSSPLCLAVYKQTHRENVRWYTKPLMEGEPEDNCIISEGADGMLLACEKARELNEKEGKLGI
jgi:hypothetical protein